MRIRIKVDTIWNFVGSQKEHRCWNLTELGYYRKYLTLMNTECYPLQNGDTITYFVRVFCIFLSHRKYLINTTAVVIIITLLLLLLLAIVVAVALFCWSTKRMETFLNRKYFSHPDNGHDGQEETKIKQRNYETIRKVIFMYLIFAFIRQGIRKNGPSGKSEFFPSRN